MTVAEYAAHYDLNEQVLRTRLRDLSKFIQWREAMIKTDSIDKEIASLKKWIGEDYLGHKMVGNSYVIFVK